MDTNDLPSSNCESGPQTGATPYSYDLRNPFYHLTKMADSSHVRRPTLISFVTLTIAATFIVFVMIQVG